MCVQWSIERIANKISRIMREKPKHMIVSACSTSFVVRIASLRFFSLDMFVVPISVL